MELWRSSLELVRDRFVKAADSSSPVGSVLIEYLFPVETGFEDRPHVRRFDGLPETVGPDVVYSWFTETPDKAVDRLGIRRRNVLYGNVAAVNTYQAIAQDAGKLLPSLPVGPLLPTETLRPIEARVKPTLQWTFAVHDLASQKIGGTSLFAERLAWVGDRVLRVDQLLDICRHSGIPGVELLPDPPTQIFTSVDDLFVASVQAIEILLNIREDQTVAAVPKAPAGDAENPPIASANTTPVRQPTLASKQVQLFGPGEKPIVKGTPKPALTTAAYDVVCALINAGQTGLTKDKLDIESKHGDARKMMKRLADQDHDWKAVLVFPGKPGCGYRIQ